MKENEKILKIDLLKNKDNENNNSEINKLSRNHIKAQPKLESTDFNLYLDNNHLKSGVINSIKLENFKKSKKSNSNNKSDVLISYKDLFLNIEEKKYMQKLGRQESDISQSYKSIDSTSIIRDVYDSIKRHEYKIEDFLSPRTDIKSFGECFPGPGDYSPKNNIENIKNLRYKNLYESNHQKNSHLKKKLKIEQLFANNLGPGLYNYTNDIQNLSYSKNPKFYLSLLKRQPLFDDNIDKNIKIGPGSYEFTSSFKPEIGECLSSCFKKNKNDDYRYKPIKANIEENFIKNNDSKILKDKKLLISFKNNNLKHDNNHSWKIEGNFNDEKYKNISINSDNKFINENSLDNIRYFSLNKVNLNNKENKFINNIHNKKKSILGGYLKYSSINAINEKSKSIEPKIKNSLHNHNPGPCYYNKDNMFSIEYDNLSKIYNKNFNSLVKDWVS